MGSTVLDTAIGLVFVFLALSLVCSGVTESLANLLNKRAAFLLRGLRQLLDGSRDRTLEWQTILRPIPPGEPAPFAAKGAGQRGATDAAGQLTFSSGGLTAALFNHPLITGTRRPSATRAKRGHNPSYLPASTFSQALLDLLVPEGSTNDSTTMSRLVERLPDTPGGQALRVLARTAGSDTDRFRADVERWYDDQMRRVSGWYKRWAKKWLVVIGLAIAISANVDTLAIGYSLYHDQPLRDTVVAQAVSTQACAQVGGTSPQSCSNQQRELLNGLSLPVGWDTGTWPDDLGGRALKILGWLITGAAVSLGGPFWFEALGKLGSWRNTGPRPVPAGGAS